MRLCHRTSLVGPSTSRIGHGRFFRDGKIVQSIILEERILSAFLMAID